MNPSITRIAVGLVWANIVCARATAEPGIACADGSSGTTVFFDDFESDQGWTSTWSSGTLTIGQWTRVDPIGTEAQPEDDYSVDGTKCYVTGNGEGATPEFDVDFGPVYLTSPTLDVPFPVEVRFAAWFQWAGNGSADDLTVQVSNNNGLAWTAAMTIACPASGCSTGWQEYAFQFQDVLPTSSFVRVRFVTSDFPNDSLTEAAVDEFRVLRCGAPGDINGDGYTDLDDYAGCPACLAGPGVPPAPRCSAYDLDDDLDVDLTDIRVFQISFTGPE